MHLVTDAELQGLAAQAFNLARHDLEQDKFIWLLASYHHPEPLYRMSRVEALINAKFGNNWLNDGCKKDYAFEALRAATMYRPPDAIVFASVCNMFEATELFRSLPPYEQAKLMEGGHDAHHAGVKKGFFRCVDGLVTVAQTPARVCHQTQRLLHGTPLGTPAVHFINADDFTGRLKLYAEPQPTVEFWKQRVQ